MENHFHKQLPSLGISHQDLHKHVLIQLLKFRKLTPRALSQNIGTEILDTISALNYLERKGVVRSDDLTDSVEKGSYSLREGENCIIGLDLGGTKLYGAIADITGNIVCGEDIQNHGKSGGECLDMITGLIDRLIVEARQRNFTVQGIGIGVPGTVQLETGLVISAPAINMKNFPLKERLVDEFGYPVYIDNDLKQASLGEAWFGIGKNYRNVVLLAIGTGIAASLVIDGVPPRGAHFRFGELGWMVPGPNFLGKKYKGFGALETEASGPGIVNRAKRILSSKNKKELLDELTSESVFEAAKRDEEWAVHCLGETTDYLAILVANIMAFYDPDIIILSGGVSRSSDMLISPIKKLVKGCVLTQPFLVPSSLGYQAGVLGAIINLMQNCPDFIH